MPAHERHVFRRCASRHRFEDAGFEKAKGEPGGHEREHKFRVVSRGDRRRAQRVGETRVIAQPSFERRADFGHVAALHNFLRKEWLGAEWRIARDYEGDPPAGIAEPLEERRCETVGRKLATIELAMFRL